MKDYVSRVCNRPRTALLKKKKKKKNKVFAHLVVFINAKARIRRVKAKFTYSRGAV